MDKENLNGTLIPGELSAPNKRRGLGHYSRVKEASLYDSDCVYDLKSGEEHAPASPSSTSSEEDQAAPQASFVVAGSSQSAAKGIGGASLKEDYTKSYQRRVLEQQKVAQSSAPEAAPTAKEQSNREAVLRNEARDLGDQIRYWKNQEGSGNYDSTTISGNISSLESRLNGIDGKYWS
jgi:hypothetical protein